MLAYQKRLHNTPRIVLEVEVKPYRGTQIDRRINDNQKIQELIRVIKVLHFSSTFGHFRTDIVTSASW